MAAPVRPASRENAGGRDGRERTPSPGRGHWLACNVGSTCFELRPPSGGGASFVPSDLAEGPKEVEVASQQDALLPEGSAAPRPVLLPPFNEALAVPQSSPPPARSGLEAARSLLLQRQSLPYKRAPMAPLAGDRCPPRAEGGRARPSGQGARAPESNTLETMAARLSEAERLNRQQAAKLTKQSQEIDALRAEVEFLRQSQEIDALRAEVGFLQRSAQAGALEEIRAEDLETLRAERDRYRRQCEEMTHFLSDYGMTWVGDGSTCSEDGDDGAGGAASDVADDCGGMSPGGTPGNIEIDIKAIVSQVEGLNAMVEREGAKIVRDRVGGAVRARLAVNDTMPLPFSFFRDGVKLGSRQFQTYDHDHTQQLIRDVLDGYFPYALKEEFPDGVALKVVNRTGLDFERWLRERAASDPDLIDNGDRIAPAAGHVLGKPRGMAAPAGNRPAQGKVSLLDSNRSSTAQATHVQVKLECGSRLVLCMEVAQTVGDLEKAVAKWCAEQGLPGSEPFLLRTAFPPRSYTDRSQTLQEAGLTPSATLFVGTVQGEAVANSVAAES